MKGLLRLYPRAWRERYGAEVEDIVGAQPPSARLAIDLLAGAVDAHWSPQTTHTGADGAEDSQGGTAMLQKLGHCSNNVNLSRRDSVLSAALTIGGSLVVSAILMVTDSEAVKTFALVMLPGVWGMSFLPFAMRGQSLRSKVVLMGGPLLILVAIGLGTVFLTA